MITNCFYYKIQAIAVSIPKGWASVGVELSHGCWVVSPSMSGMFHGDEEMMLAENNSAILLQFPFEEAFYAIFPLFLLSVYGSGDLAVRALRLLWRRVYPRGGGCIGGLWRSTRGFDRWQWGNLHRRSGWSDGRQRGSAHGWCGRSDGRHWSKRGACRNWWRRWPRAYL